MQCQVDLMARPVVVSRSFISEDRDSRESSHMLLHKSDEILYIFYNGENLLDGATFMP